MHPTWLRTQYEYASRVSKITSNDKDNRFLSVNQTLQIQVFLTFDGSTTDPFHEDVEQAIGLVHFRAQELDDVRVIKHLHQRDLWCDFTNLQRITHKQRSRTPANRDQNVNDEMQRSLVANSRNCVHVG